MRVKLYSVIMLAVVTFTACSNDEMSETQTQKGLTLSASVENLSTRASMTDESGTWKFAFENNDQVSVSNTKINDIYTFQKTGEQFTCANAMATTEAAVWYAYFPSNDVNLTRQDGTLNGVANYLAAAGKTTQATTGENGLAITLHAQVAVLRIVEADKKGALDIQVKTADGKKWVTGLSAQKNQTKFDVKTSGTKTTLLSKEKVEAGDFNYVVVPAGVGIQVYNGDVLISQTPSGLTAGKYYTITSVPTKGQSYATINGNKELVGWVQLWPRCTGHGSRRHPVHQLPLGPQRLAGKERRQHPAAGHRPAGGSESAGKAVRPAVRRSLRGGGEHRRRQLEAGVHRRQQLHGGVPGGQQSVFWRGGQRTGAVGTHLKTEVF